MRLLILLVLSFIYFDSNSQLLSKKQIDSIKSELSVSKKNDSVSVNSYIQLGNVLLNTEPELANKYTDSAFAIAEKINWKPGLAAVFRQKSVYYLNKSDYSTAISYLQKAKKIGEELKDEKLISSLDINMGLIYLQSEEYLPAIKCFKRSLAYGEKINNAQFITYSLNNLGISFLRISQPDSSIYYLEKSLPIAEENKFDQVLSFNYTNLGGAYDLKKDYKNAEKYFKKGIEKAELTGDAMSMAQALTGLAEVNTYLMKRDSAIYYCKKSLEFSKKVENLQWQKEAHIMLSENYYALGQMENALVSYKNYVVFRDSLMNDNKKSEIVKRDLQFINEKTKADLKREKERQEIYFFSGLIILLAALISFIFYKRSRDVRQKQIETLSELKIKDTELKALRLQMNPHFIGNALQSVQHFLKEHKPEEAEEYLIKFSSLMRAVLTNSEVDVIPLTKEMETLEWYIQLENLRMNYPFTYKIDIDKSLNADEIFIPPNIIQPIVENSIKHGLIPKNANGKILISIIKLNGNLIISVEDNGVGRKNSTKENNLFSKESMGIKITRERLTRLKNKNSRLEITDLISNNIPAGTRVQIILPE